MADIVNTLSTGKDSNYEIKNTNPNDDGKIVDLDPSKVCMTRTIVPNKRPIDMRDVKKFVAKVKPETTEEIAEEVSKNNKKKKVVEESGEEK